MPQSTILQKSTLRCPWVITAWISIFAASVLNDRCTVKTPSNMTDATSGASFRGAGWGSTDPQGFMISVFFSINCTFD